MSTVSKYRKRPVEIEAMLLDSRFAFKEAAKWINENGGVARLTFDPHVLFIDTIEGTMEAHMGWYVIRGVEGEFYPCKPSIFESSYEAVEAPVAVSALTGTGMPQRVAPSVSAGLQGGAAKTMPSA